MTEYICNTLCFHNNRLYKPGETLRTGEDESPFFDEVESPEEPVEPEPETMTAKGSAQDMIEKAKSAYAKASKRKKTATTTTQSPGTSASEKK